MVSIALNLCAVNRFSVCRAHPFPVSYTHLDVYKRQVLHHIQHVRAHQAGQAQIDRVLAVQPKALAHKGGEMCIRDRIGATLNLVDPRYSVEGIHEYIEEVDSRLLICLNVRCV